MAVKVADTDLAGPQVGQVVTASRGVFLAAFVGRAATVVAVGAGRLHPDAGSQAAAFDALAKHAMRRGAAADVAHADEQDGVVAHASSPFLSFRAAS